MAITYKTDEHMELLLHFGISFVVFLEFLKSIDLLLQNVKFLHSEKRSLIIKSMGFLTFRPFTKLLSFCIIVKT